MSNVTKAKVRARPLAAALGVALAVLAASQVHAASIPVIVNGQQVQFDQPPVERSGRVFVPLRGVFEKLGASVVYDNGTINATGNGRTAQLTIGSTAALVNGSPTQLDVAPFLVGARTYVPLRFVAQALGAAVNYDYNSQTVNISSANQPSAAVTLKNVVPAANAIVQADRPAVSGSFSSPVDPNSVRITLDGRDVSSTTDISGTNFLFTPPYALVATQHTVRVTGTSTAGATFDQSWSFTSGGSKSSNYITNLSPANGSTVGGTFTVSGTTMPDSAVHIVVIPTAVIGGVFAITNGTFVADVAANSGGSFSQSVNVQTVPGGKVTIRITSVAPSTNQSKTVDIVLNS